VTGLDPISFNIPFKIKKFKTFSFILFYVLLNLVAIQGLNNMMVRPK